MEAVASGDGVDSDEQSLGQVGQEVGSQEVGQEVDQKLPDEKQPEEESEQLQPGDESWVDDNETMGSIDPDDEDDHHHDDSTDGDVFEGEDEDEDKARVEAEAEALRAAVAEEQAHLQKEEEEKALNQKRLDKLVKGVRIRTFSQTTADREVERWEKENKKRWKKLPKSWMAKYPLVQTRDEWIGLSIRCKQRRGITRMALNFAHQSEAGLEALTAELEEELAELDSFMEALELESAQLQRLHDEVTDEDYEVLKERNHRSGKRGKGGAHVRVEKVSWEGMEDEYDRRARSPSPNRQRYADKPFAKGVSGGGRYIAADDDEDVDDDLITTVSRKPHPMSYRSNTQAFARMHNNFEQHSTGGWTHNPKGYWKYTHMDGRSQDDKPSGYKPVYKPSYVNAGARKKKENDIKLLQRLGDGQKVLRQTVAQQEKERTMRLREGHSRIEPAENMSEDKAEEGAAEDDEDSDSEGSGQEEGGITGAEGAGATGQGADAAGDSDAAGVSGQTVSADTAAAGDRHQQPTKPAAPKPTGSAADGGIDGGVGGTGGRRVVLGSYVQQGLRAVSREVKIRFPDLEKQLGASRESNEGGGKHFDTIGFRPHLLKMKQHMEAAEDVYRGVKEKLISSGELFDMRDAANIPEMRETSLHFSKQWLTELRRVSKDGIVGAGVVVGDLKDGTPGAEVAPAQKMLLQPSACFYVEGLKEQATTAQQAMQLLLSATPEAAAAAIAAAVAAAAAATAVHQSSDCATRHRGRRCPCGSVCLCAKYQDKDGGGADGEEQTLVLPKHSSRNFKTSSGAVRTVLPWCDAISTPRIKPEAECSAEVEHATFQHTPAYFEGYRCVVSAARVALQFRSFRRMIAAKAEIEKLFDVLCLHNRHEYPSVIGWSDICLIVALGMPAPAVAAAHAWAVAAAAVKSAMEAVAATLRRITGVKSAGAAAAAAAAMAACVAEQCEYATRPAMAEMASHVAERVAEAAEKATKEFAQQAKQSLREAKKKQKEMAKEAKGERNEGGNEEEGKEDKRTEEKEAERNEEEEAERKEEEGAEGAEGKEEAEKQNNGTQEKEQGKREDGKEEEETEADVKKGAKEAKEGAAKLKKGQPVKVDFQGKGKYYPGKITECRPNGTYDITYDDGETEQRVEKGRIELLAAAQGEAPTLEGGGQYESTQMLRCEMTNHIDTPTLEGNGEYEATCMVLYSSDEATSENGDTSEDDAPTLEGNGQYECTYMMREAGQAFGRKGRQNDMHADDEAVAAEGDDGFEGQTPPKFANGQLVLAQWRGGEEYFAAQVVVVSSADVRDDLGSCSHTYELRYLRRDNGTYEDSGKYDGASEKDVAEQLIRAQPSYAEWAEMATNAATNAARHAQYNAASQMQAGGGGTGAARSKNGKNERGWFVVGYHLCEVQLQHLKYAEGKESADRHVRALTKELKSNLRQHKRKVVVEVEDPLGDEVEVGFGSEKKRKRRKKVVRRRLPKAVVQGVVGCALRVLMSQVTEVIEPPSSKPGWKTTAVLAEPKHYAPHVRKEHGDSIFSQLGGGASSVARRSFATDDERANCRFKPQRSAAHLAQEKSTECGYDFFDRMLEDGANFLARQDTKKRVQDREMEQKRGEENYEKLCESSKKRCTGCGAVQSYDEVLEKRECCPNCPDCSYKLAHNWSDVEKRFFARMKKNEDKVRKDREAVKNMVRVEEHTQGKAPTSLRQKVMMNRAVEIDGREVEFIDRMVRDVGRRAEKGRKIEVLKDDPDIIVWQEHQMMLATGAEDDEYVDDEDQHTARRGRNRGQKAEVHLRMATESFIANPRQ
jgi:hypothetical protein